MPALKSLLMKDRTTYNAKPIIKKSQSIPIRSPLDVDKQNESWLSDPTPAGAGPNPLESSASVSIALDVMTNRTARLPKYIYEAKMAKEEIFLPATNTSPNFFNSDKMKLPYTSKIGLPRRVQRWVVAAFIIVAGAMSIWRTSISRGKNSAGVGTSAVQYVNDAFDGSKTEHTAQAQGEVSVDSIVSERLSSIHQTVLRRREPPDLSLVWEDDMEVAGNATDEDRPESHVVFLSLGEMEKLRKKNLIKRRTPSSIAINGSPAGQTFVDLTLSIQVEPLERYPKETGHSRTIEGWTSVVNMPYQVKFARTFLAYAAGIVFTLSMFNVSISQATTVVSSHLRSINLDKKKACCLGR
ncbi:hypothetical protein BC829DRAFT_415721 [Chytridium lagenaria]|nr:hypothetical protein BC829DRAFT_415721 [Chytridium lagenaria]